MDATSSFINFRYIHFLLKQNRRFIILMSVTMIVFNPVLVLMLGILNEISLTLLNTGKIINILLALISCFLVAPMMFSYLNRKTSLDTYHALPIRKSALHVTIFTAGLIILLIPFTISWFLALPLQLFAVDGKILASFAGYFYTIIPLIAVYSSICFVQVNTGTAVDSVIYALIVLSLPLFAYLCFHVYAGALLLGYDYGLNWTLLTYLSPFVAAFSHSINNAVCNTALLFNQLFWLITSLIIETVTIVIYLRRPSERANNPFTNRFFFPLVSTSFIILLQIILYAFFYLVTYSQASISVLSIMLSIMIADVIYIILDTVANRSFRHILKASLHYFFVSMLVVLVIAPVNLTKGFGFVTNVPTGIDYVEVIYDDNLSLMLSYSKSDQYFYHDSYQMTMKFTEDDDIALITSLHQLIIDNYYYFDYNANNFNANYANIEDEYHLNTFDGLDYSGTTYISFTYHLQNGLIVSRNYNVNYNWLASLMTLYQKPTVEQYRIPLALYYDQADSIDSIQLIDKLKLTGTDVNADFNLDAFTEAYRLDYQNLPADGLLSTDYVYYGRLSANLCKYQSKESTYCTTDYLDIDSRFTRTLAYLNSIGMTFPESDYNVKARIIFPETDEAFYGFQIANPDYYSYSTEQLYNYTELSSEQLQAVIPYLLPYGLTAEPTLLFCVSSDNSSSTFLIDPQHEDEVRTLLTDNIIKQNNDIYNIIYGYELNED